MLAKTRADLATLFTSRCCANNERVSARSGCISNFSRVKVSMYLESVDIEEEKLLTNRKLRAQLKRQRWARTDRAI